MSVRRDPKEEECTRKVVNVQTGISASVVVYINRRQVIVMDNFVYGVPPPGAHTMDPRTEGDTKDRRSGIGIWLEDQYTTITNLILNVCNFSLLL